MTRLEVHQEEDDGDEEESDESGGFDGSLMSSKLVDAEEGWGPPGENQQYRQQRRWRQQFPPIFAIVAAALRKSLVTCSVEPREDVCASMDIGWPTNVRHIAHVTFDRFQGFLGLPVELEHDVLRTAPSASSAEFLVRRFYVIPGPAFLFVLQRAKLGQSFPKNARSETVRNVF
ncbi:hypothetical protein Taro_035189 [Colocasia esculenta]|uniref:CRIB domain-containing protein n=1 Tax=Colocasia esculenta TaxID=4460 RepID=A0A843WCG8_COLES|nr:hypothetical protein [Colocasia esculenta]